MKLHLTSWRQLSYISVRNLEARSRRHKKAVKFPALEPQLESRDRTNDRVLNYAVASTQNEYRTSILDFPTTSPTVWPFHPPARSTASDKEPSDLWSNKSGGSGSTRLYEWRDKWIIRYTDLATDRNAWTAATINITQPDLFSLSRQSHEIKSSWVIHFQTWNAAQTASSQEVQEINNKKELINKKQFVSMCTLSYK